MFSLLVIETLLTNEATTDQIYTVYSNPLNMTYRSSDTTVDSEFSKCMTRSSNKDLIQPFKNLKQAFWSSRKLSKTWSLDYLNSSEFNFISDLEDQFQKEET
ncbi:hypothetical protein Tco_0044472 [Tanacetum coccineum]